MIFYILTKFFDTPSTPSLTLGHDPGYQMKISFDTKGPSFRNTKIVSEYDQEITQSQTADKPTVPQGRATQQSRDTRKTN